jgi:hypothetical protein
MKNQKKRLSVNELVRVDTRNFNRGALTNHLHILLDRKRELTSQIKLIDEEVRKLQVKINRSGAGI